MFCMTSSEPDGHSLDQLEERFRLLVQSVRDYAIFLLDTQGYVQSWNAGAERFTGYCADEVIGKHFSIFYAKDALEARLPEHELSEALRIGSFEDEGWRLRKDGSRFWANVVLTALRAPSGPHVGFAKITRDLTERRSHDEALRQSEERFRLLVEGVSDYAIFMLDVNGNIATWNVGAQRIKGYEADEIIGKHFSLFYPSEAVESGWPAHELTMAAQTGSFVDEGWRRRKDGTQFWANVTITALRDATGRLIGYAKLTRDLTDRKRTEAMQMASAQRDEILAAERSARMASQRAARIKDEFLSTLSHELRTPLNSILGWTQILMKRRDGAATPADFMRAIEVIDRNARAQAQLIDDLLDLSRVMSGKLRLDMQQIAVLDIVRAAVQSAEPAAQAKDIQLQAMLDTSPTTINADGGRLQQVVWNLLSNAIKFTPKGGKVQVVLQRVNSHIELSVSDTGIGITESFLPHVFERFAQRDSSSTRSYGGLGLGLAITKQLVELHGGSIRVASQGENKGATFFVDLPLSIVQIEDESTERAHPTAPTSVDDMPLPELGGALIFVVDDEPDAGDVLRRVLEAQNARVQVFDSADAALEALKHTKPDLIVSDIGMARVDGYQFMRALRATEPKGQRTPALAVTAFARPEDRKRSLLAGYQGHVSKPFDVGELLLSVANLVNR